MFLQFKLPPGHYHQSFSGHETIESVMDSTGVTRDSIDAYNYVDDKLIVGWSSVIRVRLDKIQSKRPCCVIVSPRPHKSAILIPPEFSST